MVALNYYLGPPEWITDGATPHYRAPVGTVGMVDLRSNVKAGTQGVQTDCFFLAVDPASPLSTTSHALLGSGDMRDIRSTGQMRSAWLARTGVAATGDTIADLLWSTLTDAADPTGLAACKPLMPGRDGEAELYVGGHSLVRREPFDWPRGGRWVSHVRDVIRSDIRAVFDAEQRGEIPEGHHRRMLTDLGRKFRGADWREFYPPGIPQQPPLPHATTKTETWPTNSTTLSSGQDNAWTEVDNDLEVTSGTLSAVTLGSHAVARMDFDFGAADHYAQTQRSADIGSPSSTWVWAVGCRKDSTGTLTYYYADTGSGGTWRTFKRVAGTFTGIGSNTTAANAVNDVLKLDVNGSSVQRFKNGASQNTATDTAITGNVRVVASMFASSATNKPTQDNFEASDGLGGSLIYRRQHRAILSM